MWLSFHAARVLCGWDLCGHVAQRVRADSWKLDKQSTLPKKEICLLTNLQLLPPSSPYSLASSTNKIRLQTCFGVIECTLNVCQLVEWSWYKLMGLHLLPSLPSLPPSLVLHSLHDHP